jgi:hypothetical protein
MAHKVWKDVLMVGPFPSPCEKLRSSQKLTPLVLAEELATGMRLLGVTSLDQVRPDMVNAQRLLNEMWRPDSTPTVKSRL